MSFLSALTCPIHLNVSFELNFGPMFLKNIIFTEGIN